MKPLQRRQRGATLIVALIMIALITLLIVNAFTLSSSNLKAVGNMQAREETIAAANQALEVVMSSAFTTLPVAQEILVDINKDGTNDFTVNVAAPICIKAVESPVTSLCDTDHPELCADPDWFTDWDIKATVTDAATGAKAIIHQGARVKLTKSQKTAVCNAPTVEI